MDKNNFFKRLDKLDDSFLVEAMKVKKIRRKTRSVIKTIGYTVTAALVLICVFTGGFIFTNNANMATTQPPVQTADKGNSQIEGEFVCTVKDEGAEDNYYSGATYYKKYKSENVYISEDILNELNNSFSDESTFVVEFCPCNKEINSVFSSYEEIEKFYEMLKKYNDINMYVSSVKSTRIIIDGYESTTVHYYPIVAELTQNQLANLKIDNKYEVYIVSAQQKLRSEIFKNK